MRRAKKIKLWIALIFRILLVIAIIITAVKADWFNLTFSVITFGLTFLPSIISRRLKIDYPSEFEIVILFFLYASVFLGEVLSFYARFWWWDLFLHTLSGIIVGIIGFSLVYSLNQESLALKLSPGFVAIFSFSFALALGGLWEIFEFSMDSLFGFNMQKHGLVDTMWDLIVDAFGALVISLLGYYYLKKDFNLFKKMEKKFFVRMSE